MSTAFSSTQQHADYSVRLAVGTLPILDNALAWHLELDAGGSRDHLDRPEAQMCRVQALSVASAGQEQRPKWWERWV